MQEGKNAFIFIFTIDFRCGDTGCLNSTLISFQLVVCKLELNPEINLCPVSCSCQDIKPQQNK